MLRSLQFISFAFAKEYKWPPDTTKTSAIGLEVSQRCLHVLTCSARKIDTTRESVVIVLSLLSFFTIVVFFLGFWSYRLVQRTPKDRDINQVMLLCA